MENNIEYTNTLTDDQKEKIFNVSIEHLTKEEIIERFGNIFLSSQKDIDPEIKGILTNDFFNNLMENETTD